MDLNKLEQDIKQIVSSIDQTEFIYNFLLAYQLPKSSITRLKKGDYNLAKDKSDVLWKKKVFFKAEYQQDLHLTIDTLQKDDKILKQHPRFIIVTNFKTLLSVDLKTGDTLDIPFKELAQNSTFFLPWAGLEKTQIQSVNLADVKAAEKLAKLYDIIILENEIADDKERHGLNIFLSRLLFCFFAEDTGIFGNDQFTNAVASHTNEDGSNCQDYLIKLFAILNVKERRNEPAHLKKFPYVNGGLFAVDYPAPKLNAKARKMIIESGALNWRLINPDIFGSMMQAVVHSDQRSSLGMHYTSVANIMKVIEPLFLNELKEQLDHAHNNENKLTQLLERLYHLRIFDPACGSGNFLIITYKELCKLEIEIFKQLQQLKRGQMSFRQFAGKIQLTQFYGIELDDFAHETAKLSLWLAEHQMNLAFKEVFGSAKPTLPLQDGGHIICGNATRVNWEKVCPKDEGAEIYIMGNPPYLGARMQSKAQKAEVKNVLGHLKGYNNLDYIACWFVKAADYILDYKAQFSFVSTNSICQGTQVAILWPEILNKLELGFAHQSFSWANNAKGNAGVTCIIVGVRNFSSGKKLIYKDNIERTVKNISPYLASTKTYFIKNRRTTLSNIIPIYFGSMANDTGGLLLDVIEYKKLISSSPESESLIKKCAGSREFINGIDRYCLWIEDKDVSQAMSILPIKKRLEKVRIFREKSSRAATQLLAKRPYRFGEVRHQEGTSIIIPKVSSERRSYIPAGFLDSDTIITDLAFAIYNPDPHTFSIISSRIHMTWVRAVAGRLKTDYRYSSALCYNTFPFPEISEAQKTTLEDHVFNVLDEREKHPEKTMAELYDPDKMPEGLRQAHHEMDVAVEQCYRKKPFSSDEERLEYLFKLYEEMIEAEKKNNG